MTTHLQSQNFPPGQMTWHLCDPHNSLSVIISWLEHWPDDGSFIELHIFQLEVFTIGKPLFSKMDEFYDQPIWLSFCKARTCHQTRWPGAFVTHTTHYLSLSADWNIVQMMGPSLSRISSNWRFSPYVDMFRDPQFGELHISQQRKRHYTPKQLCYKPWPIDQLNLCKRKLQLHIAYFPIFEGSAAVMNDDVLMLVSLKHIEDLTQSNCEEASGTCWWCVLALVKQNHHIKQFTEIVCSKWTWIVVTVMYIVQLFCFYISSCLTEAPQ